VSILESKTVATFNKRTIQNFIDIIILKHLKNNPLTSGYEVMGHFHKKFDILLSAGTIYHALYSLERKNLIEGNMDQGKRTYKLTKQGEKLLDNIYTTKDQIQEVVSAVFSEA